MNIPLYEPQSNGGGGDKLCMVASKATCMVTAVFSHSHVTSLISQAWTLTHLSHAKLRIQVFSYIYHKIYSTLFVPPCIDWPRLCKAVQTYLQITEQQDIVDHIFELVHYRMEYPGKGRLSTATQDIVDLDLEMCA